MSPKTSAEPTADLDTVLWFGRGYKGLTVRQALEETGGPGFLLWAHKKVEGFSLGWELLSIVENDPERTRWEEMTGFHWSRYKEKEVTS